MKSIQVKNFRSFQDSGRIEFNKINLFLGKNSSGKSSILRLFPLFKQSILHELRGPLMWYDETYDFGSYANVLSRHPIGDGKLKFLIELQLPKQKCPSSGCGDCFIYENSINPFLNEASSCILEIVVDGDKKGTFLKELNIHLSQHEIILTTDSRRGSVRIFLDKDELSTTPVFWKYKTKGLLPDLISKKPSGRSYVLSQLFELSGLKSIKGKDLEELIHYKTFSTDDIYCYFQSLENNNLAKMIVDSYAKDSNELDLFCRNLNLFAVESFLLLIDQMLKADFCKSRYIEPIRFGFDRYIRNKDFAVDEINSSGNNVVDYILSLSKKQRIEFSKFIKDSLNIEIQLSNDADNSYFDNQSVYVIIDGEKDNIVDVGQGYSQVLPIAVMLWDVAYKQHKCEFVDTVVIEQPEVHLHPSMQGDMVRLFLNALLLSKKKHNPIRLIIETHSPVIVNRMGKMLRLGKVNSEDISVFLFEKENGISKVRTTFYGNDGRIKEWPIGFLD